MKLPRLTKKLRVMVSWILDRFFAREIEQMITLRNVEALSELAGRLRPRAAGKRYLPPHPCPKRPITFKPDLP